jgi:HNH endonuclease
MNDFQEVRKRAIAYRKWHFDRWWKVGEISPICGTPCWIWEGSKTTRFDADGTYNPYGVFYMHDGVTSASRASFRLHNPIYFYSIPRRLEVHHICRNRLCVNPAHLELVTRSQNVRDIFTKIP